MKELDLALELVRELRQLLSDARDKAPDNRGITDAAMMVNSTEGKVRRARREQEVAA